MHRFIFKLFVFLLPIIVSFVALEIFLFKYPNTFNTKAFHLKENLDIETLFLGSSHSQNAINPVSIISKSANLAYGSQDYQLDSAIFFKHINKLKNLKHLFIEVDYHSLEDMRSKSYFRLAWYYRYYGIVMKKISLVEKLSLFASSPSFFKNHLLEYLNINRFKYKLNEAGFTTNSFPGAFKELSYDRNKIMNSAYARINKSHFKISLKNYSSNRTKICAVINMAQSKNIKVTLLKTPLFTSYKQFFDEKKLLRRNNFIDSLLLKNKNIRLLDLENDIRFKIEDFKNDNHLNPNGAEKMSSIINEYLLTKKK